MLPTPHDLERRLDLAMSWFPTLCRNLGRTIHDLKKPGGNDPTGSRQRRVSVEQQEITPTTTLRRTTIEEIEIRPTPADRNEAD